MAEGCIRRVHLQITFFSLKVFHFYNFRQLYDLVIFLLKKIKKLNNFISGLCVHLHCHGIGHS